MVLPHQADLPLAVFHFQLDHTPLFHQFDKLLDIVDFHYALLMSPTAARSPKR